MVDIEGAAQEWLAQMFTKFNRQFNGCMDTQLLRNSMKSCIDHMNREMEQLGYSYEVVLYWEGHNFALDYKEK